MYTLLKLYCIAGRLKQSQNIGNLNSIICKPTDLPTCNSITKEFAPHGLLNRVRVLCIFNREKVDIKIHFMVDDKYVPSPQCQKRLVRCQNKIHH